MSGEMPKHICGDLWIEGPVTVVAGADSFTGYSVKPPCEACNTIYLKAERILSPETSSQEGE